MNTTTIDGAAQCRVHTLSSAHAVSRCIAKEARAHFKNQLHCDIHVVGQRQRRRPRPAGPQGRQERPPAPLGAHRLVLAAASPFLSKLLQEAEGDGGEPALLFLDAPDHVVRILVAFLYGKPARYPPGLEGRRLCVELKQWLGVLQVQDRYSNLAFDSEDDGDSDDDEDEAVVCLDNDGGGAQDVQLRTGPGPAVVKASSTLSGSRGGPSSGGKEMWLCGSCKSVTFSDESKYEAHLMDHNKAIASTCMDALEYINLRSASTRSFGGGDDAGTGPGLACPCCLQVVVRGGLCVDSEVDKERERQEARDHFFQCRNKNNELLQQLHAKRAEAKAHHQAGEARDLRIEPSSKLEVPVDDQTDEEKPPKTVEKYRPRPACKRRAAAFVPIDPEEPVAERSRQGKGVAKKSRRTPRNSSSYPCRVCGDIMSSRENLKLHSCKSLLGIANERDIRPCRVKETRPVSPGGPSSSQAVPKKSRSKRKSGESSTSSGSRPGTASARSSSRASLCSSPTDSVEPDNIVENLCTAAPLAQIIIDDEPCDNETQQAETRPTPLATIKCDVCHQNVPVHHFLKHSH